MGALVLFQGRSEEHLPDTYHASPSGIRDVLTLDQLWEVLAVGDPDSLFDFPGTVNLVRESLPEDYVLSYYSPTSWDSPLKGLVRPLNMYIEFVLN